MDNRERPSLGFFLRKMQLAHGANEKRIRRLNDGEEPTPRDPRYVRNDVEIQAKKRTFEFEWALTVQMQNGDQTLLGHIANYLDYQQHRLTTT